MSNETTMFRDSSRDDEQIKKIRKIEKLNFVGLQNCGHLPHLDLPSLSSKIIQDYFLEKNFYS